ncbi:MAG: hypothetical protein K1X39_05785 [Thermoflexales bacterium]|nr:hypothetical protein [Thermoflexales bacterium]
MALGSVATGAIGLILAFLLFLQGFSALRRPVEELVKYDPVGKAMLVKRGETFTRRVYRLMGVSFLLLAFAASMVALGFLRGGQ